MAISTDDIEAIVDHPALHELRALSLRDRMFALVVSIMENGEGLTAALAMAAVAAIMARHLPADEQATVACHMLVEVDRLEVVRWQ
jgi:hypothetical protein